MSTDLLEAMGELPFVADLEARVLHRVLSTAEADPRLARLPVLDVTRLVQLAVRGTILDASEVQDAKARVEEEALAAALALPALTEREAFAEALASGGVSVGPWSDGAWRVIPSEPNWVLPERS